MSQFGKLLVPYLIRNFMPMNSFSGNILVEIKGFTNLEVSNNIAPFYFFASTFAVFFSKAIIHQFGLESTSIILTAIYLGNMVFFLNFRKRSFISASLVYFVSGFVATFDLIYRLYIGETNTAQSSVESQYSYISLVRAVASSFSSIFGQEIVNRTGFYEINIHISIFTQFISLLISIYNAINETDTKELGNSSIKDAILNMDKVAICAFLAGGIAGCYNIFTKLFVSIIFRDRSPGDKTGKINNNSVEPSAKEINNSVESGVKENKTGQIAIDDTTNHNTNPSYSKKNISDDPTFWKTSKTLVFDALHFPIHHFSTFLIFIVTFIFPKYKGEGTAQKRYLNGNADAISNVMCSQITHLISVYGPDENKELSYISFLLFSTLSLLLMTKMKHKFMLYLMYLCTGVFSRSCCTITKGVLKDKSGDNNLILASYGFESIFHVIINQICKIIEVDSVLKTRLYGCIGLAIFFGILFSKLI